MKPLSSELQNHPFFWQPLYPLDLELSSCPSRWSKKHLKKVELATGRKKPKYAPLVAIPRTAHPGQAQSKTPPAMYPGKACLHVIDQGHQRWFRPRGRPCRLIVLLGSRAFLHPHCVWLWIGQSSGGRGCA